MGHADSKPLLRTLAKKEADEVLAPGFTDALRLSEGTLDYEPAPNLWEGPVRERLESDWRTAREYYAQRQPGAGDGDDTDAGVQRAHELAERFGQSDEAQKLPGPCRDRAESIAGWVLEYAWTYAGVPPGELNERALREVLLEIVPQKVTGQRELFERVTPVTQALLAWLGSQGILKDPAPLISAVGRWEGQIVDNAMNSRYWGSAKAFAMRALAEGVDVTDQSAIDAYMAGQAARVLEKLAEESDDETDDGEACEVVPAPFVKKSPKIGRNEPCPCGSGKKYKKCCARPGPPK